MDAKTFLMAKKLAGSGGPKIEVEPLEITENGTYTAPAGKAYSPITANVPNPSTGTLSIDSNGTYDVTSYASAEVNVPSSGGGGEITSGVKFIDYDGTAVETWDSASVASKTSLPTNPTHTGLVARGWNWSLANIKSYAAKYPNAIVLVGQMYKTTSGLTEIDITVTKQTGLTVTCNMSGNKNWGDGTTNTKTSHTYTDYGDYTITCGGTSIPAGTSSSGGMFGSSSSNNNRYWCTAIRIGEGVTKIGNYAFANCYSLTSITIPDSVTSIGTYVFNNCYSITSITIPDSVTSIGSNAFNNCYSLTSITIPASVTDIGGTVFNNCYSLTSITIPDSVTSIGGTALQGCYSLTSITIPDSVTSIGTYVFQNCYSLTSITIPDSVTSIGVSAFQNCYSLTSITILDSVTSIGNNAFANCYSLTGYDFSSATSIPTISNTNAFTNINGICKIIVPDALYDSWIAATNWATYANYIYKASEVA